MGDIFASALKIVAAIFLLGIIVMIHEIGHFVSGLKLGFRVLEFSIGMGPRLIKIHRKGIDYSIKLFPFGGSTRYLGEEGDSAEDGAFFKMPPWKRFIAISAGAIMNILFAILLSIVLVGVYGGDYTPRIDNVNEGSPAEVAGIQSNDLIVNVNGMDIVTREDVTTGIALNDSNITLTVLRGDNDYKEFTLIPKLDEESGRKLIGVTFTREKYGPLTTIGKGTQYAFDNLSAIIGFLGDLFTFKIPAQQLSSEVGGPVMIGVILYNAVGSGFEWVLMIAIMISINLGVMNLLPLPALDGGRLVFIVIEWIRGKAVPPEKEGMVHLIGIVLLMGLIVLLTFKDIRGLIQ